MWMGTIVSIMRVRQIYRIDKLILALNNFTYILAKEAHEGRPNDEVGNKDKDHEDDEHSHLSVD